MKRIKTFASFLALHEAIRTKSKKAPKQGEVYIYEDVYGTVGHNEARKTTPVWRIEICGVRAVCECFTKKDALKIARIFPPGTGKTV